MEDIFKAISALLAVVATAPLVWGVLKGKQRPSRMTWTLWLALTLILAAGMYDAGELSWQMITVVACDVVIVPVVLWYGVGGRTRLDILTLGACIVIILLWQWSGIPLVAISLSLLASLVATTPMFANLWREPMSESPLPYSVMLLSTFFQGAALLAAPRPLVIESWLQVVGYVIIQGAILTLLLRGRMKNFVFTI